MQNGVYVKKDISVLGYFHNEKGVLLQTFISFHYSSFGGIVLKIEFVVFVYELINYEIIFLLLDYVTSKSDLQPSTAIANQLPGQIVITEIPRIVLNSPQH